MLRLASGVPAIDEQPFHDHVAGCTDCQALVGQGDDDDWRWIARIPTADALGEDILGLPMVDPIVFGSPTELASGGMGRITRVFDRRLGREVAVKEMLDRSLRTRFEREVWITARLQHPAIVPIYEAGTFPDGSTFYTMRLVPGRSLADAIAEAPTLEARLRLLPHVRAAAEAVAYAHSRGVIHRDLKPGNILVGEFGETVVIDWGLAKQAGDAELEVTSRASKPNLTRMGSVLGTPCFMSPSTAAGIPADATDDVYALGAILYNLLAGEPPYWDSSPHDSDALIAATIARPPTPIALRAPEAPTDLHAIVEHAMPRDNSAARTATQFLEELARFETGQLLVSKSYRLRELVFRWLRQHRLGVTLAVLAVISAVLVGGLLLRLDRAADELAIRERGDRLTKLYGDVARQAYVIDRDLLRLESALEGLTTATAWALEAPDQPFAKVFFDTDFESDKTRPDDFTSETAYRWSVSVEHPVVSVAPGVERAPLLPKIRRLVPLRHHIRDMVVAAAQRDDHRVLSAAEATKLMVTRAGPIDYAYVDLPEGVHVIWPGNATLRRDYDVRTASFFQNSAKERGRHWGAPYVDSSTATDGDELVLPCTKGIWSATGELLGVAGVEMTVTKMLDTSMRMTNRSTLRVSLVDKQGRTVIDSSAANQTFPSNGRDEAIEFPPFELPSVAAAIAAEREGILETTRDGRPVVVAYVRLDAIRWYYVVEVDAASLGAAK
jgi:serine/threonine protein kinase